MRPFACIGGTLAHCGRRRRQSQMFSEHISVSLIMNCEIPWESIDSSACPLDVRPPFVRPPFSPPASWLKPRQGWPVYSAGAATPTGFLPFGTPRRWHEISRSKRRASISSSQPSPPNMWVMTSSTNGTERGGELRVFPGLRWRRRCGARSRGLGPGRLSNRRPVRTPGRWPRPGV